MKFENYTPHKINLNDGRSFDPTGTVARVSVSFTKFDKDLICNQVFGEVTGLPDPDESNEVRYIVSGMVLSALNGIRTDVIAPATGHEDTVRNEKGHIQSVPGFVK